VEEHLKEAEQGFLDLGETFWNLVILLSFNGIFWGPRHEPLGI
jgi:hypothetical protein